jgi:hypothetical protein
MGFHPNGMFSVKHETDKITISDFKLHGLGHLTNPFPSRKEKWQDEIWHDLLILQYVDHPEYKYDGIVGLLMRKSINVDGVLIIGKENNKIEDQPLFVADAQVFKDKKSLCKKILSIRQCDAEKMGIGRSASKFIKDGIRNGRVINLKTSAVKRLIRTMS